MNGTYDGVGIGVDVGKVYILKDEVNTQFGYLLLIRESFYNELSISDRELYKRNKENQ